MSAYFATVSKTSSVSSTVPIFNLVGNTARRLKIREISWGCDAAPTDDAVTFALMRTSARGTQSGTVITPRTLDPASPASVALFDAGWSVNPSITADSELYKQAVNQRAPWRWVPPQGMEIIVPATSGAGLALVAVVSTSPANYVFSIYWEEII